MSSASAKARKRALIKALHPMIVEGRVARPDSGWTHIAVASTPTLTQYYRNGVLVPRCEIERELSFLGFART